MLWALATCLSFIGCASATQSYLNAFELLPSERDWYKIVKGYDTEDQCRHHVQVYMQPFREYQLSAKLWNIPNSNLKSALTTALALLYDAVNAFQISSEEYGNKSFEADMLISANSVFRFGKAKKVRPIFDPQSLEAFSRQRFIDFFANDPKYIVFLKRRHDYMTTLQEWISITDRLPEEDFRTIMPRNLDLKYAKERIIYYVYKMMAKTFEYPDRNLPIGKYFAMRFVKDEWVRKTELMGNHASLNATPPSLYLTFVTVFYTLLVVVLF